jgi:HEPN domain-containing protein
MRYADLQRMSERNIESALILFRANNWSNSYYLAGYAIEMALKSIISRKFASDTIPDKNFVISIYTHKIKDLLGLTGLKSEFELAMKADSLLGSNWAICSEWTPECRYQEKSDEEAFELLNAISDEKHGVLPWIKVRW